MNRHLAKLLTAATLASLCAAPQIASAINHCGPNVFATQNIGTVTQSPITVRPTGDVQVSPTSTTLTFSKPGPFSIQVAFNYEPECPGELYEVTFTGTYAPSVAGYIDPKFVVVGVTYAPPGPSANTYVSYTNSALVGVTNTVSQSFKSGTTFSASVSGGFSIAGVIAGSKTGTYSTTSTQTAASSEAITTSLQVQNGEKTFGTSSYFAPVNHDYDIIWVWLNPVLLMTAGGTSVTWTGYGFDENDQPDPDIVPIQLGYLNGDFGAIPPDIQASLNRTWAASQIWASGTGPALTAADLAQIAATDPFSVSTYGQDYIGYTPPVSETSDHRFTLSDCSSVASVVYLQAAPSTTPGVDSCTLTYTDMSVAAQSLTSSTSQTFSVDVSFKASFWITFSADLKDSQTLTWTTETQKQITNTTTSTAALSVQGPPCNNVTAGVGPCVPVYDASLNEPTDFDIYQDNVYGSFMFAPIHFYP